MYKILFFKSQGVSLINLLTMSAASTIKDEPNSNSFFKKRYINFSVSHMHIHVLVDMPKLTFMCISISQGPGNYLLRIWAYI